MLDPGRRASHRATVSTAGDKCFLCLGAISPREAVEHMYSLTVHAQCFARESDTGSDEGAG